MSAMAHSGILDGLSPSDLGMPAKFQSFRRSQTEALEWLNIAPSPIQAGCLPTGSGKTLLAMSHSSICDAKTVYLVSTKALQDQIVSDFGGPSTAVRDVRGRANYRCPNYVRCGDGIDNDCSLHTTLGCPYTAAVDEANRAAVVVTNYAYWLYARSYNAKALEFGRPVGLLICDEAHALVDELSSFVGVRFSAAEMGKHAFPRDGIMESDAVMDWANWASAKATKCKRQMDRINDKKDLDYQAAEDLFQRCAKIQLMNDNWVWQFDDGAVAFEPIHVAPYTKRLFAGVRRILIMSATLNEYALKLLLPTGTEYDYRAWHSVFPPQNAPIYHIPTLKLTWRSTDEDYKTLLERADQIIGSRSDRRGIIHTVSYGRARRALQHSAYRHRFVWNETAGELPRAVERFRSGPVGSVLVTPSVSTGFDFPGADCEYQICLKFPFPNETQRVVKERCKRIPGYRLWSAAQEFVQMCGRARRYDTDRCETFCLDNSVAQLSGPEGRSYLPPGFRIWRTETIPPRPPKL